MATGKSGPAGWILKTFFRHFIAFLDIIDIIVNVDHYSENAMHVKMLLTFHATCHNLSLKM